FEVREVNERDVGSLADEQSLRSSDEGGQPRYFPVQVDDNLERSARGLVSAQRADRLQQDGRAAIDGRFREWVPELGQQVNRGKGEQNRDNGGGEGEQKPDQPGEPAAAARWWL